jgi:hypothetical protein
MSYGSAITDTYRIVASRELGIHGDDGISWQMSPDQRHHVLEGHAIVISSAEEGPMEGVVVSARKDGATITVSVVTDKEGKYTFPAARLEPGRYRLSIRAGGYELESPKAVDLSAAQSATAERRG